MSFASIPMNLLKPILNMQSLFKVLTKLKKMFILIFELNNFLNSIYQSILDGYFSFMLQAKFAA
jgi:hypothetical protein